MKFRTTVVFLAIFLFFFSVSAILLNKNIVFVNNSYAYSVLGDDDSEEEEDHSEEDEDHEDYEDSEDHEDDEEDDTDEVEETVSNSNGTTSTIQRKTEDDGSEKLKIKTYNTNGDLIEEKEYEGGDDEAELQIKQFDNFGNKLLELKYKDENNNEIKLQVEGTDSGQSKIRYDFENQKMYVEVEDENENESDEENEVEIEVENNRFKIQYKNSFAYANFPIVVNEETGKIYVITAEGQVELKQLPDAIENKALESIEIDEITETKLEVDDNLKYLIEGEKNDKLLGIIQVAIQKTLVYNPETGELENINLSPLNRILNILSI